MAAGVLSAAPSMASSSSGTPLDQLIPELAVAQTSNDALPDNMKLEDLGPIDATSLRHLGEDELAEYWVGRSGSTQVCLIITLRDYPGVGASACGEATDFYNQGIALSTGNAEIKSEAYLLPADVPIGELTNAKSLSSGVGLLVAGSASIPTDSVEIIRPSGQTFTFSPLQDVQERR